MKRLVTALAAAAVALTVTANASAADGVPYKDPSASRGVLTVCDKDLKKITKGSVSARPSIWRVVSSQPAPEDYRSDGRLAALFGYVPRPDLDPREWGGEQVSGDTTYSDVGHPMAQFTEIDEPLATFLDRYPPTWKGLIQFRMYYGNPDKPYWTRDYASADIQINGDTFTILNQGDTPCDVGTAKSSESFLPDFQQRLAQVKAQDAASASASAPAQPGASSAVTAGAAPTAPGTGSPSATGTTTDGGAATGTSAESPRWLPVAALTLIAVLFAVAGTVLYRRRGATTNRPTDMP